LSADVLLWSALHAAASEARAARAQAIQKIIII